MNVKELKEMITLMQENGLSELEIEKNGFKIRLKKGGGAVEIRRESGGQASYSNMLASDYPPSQSEQPMKEPEGVIVVRSPMVGTFYAAPAPDKDPYVTKGKSVKAGDVLCIIEAMKLMNEIKSEVSGVILDILIANHQPVEFDQPLFKIQKM